MQHDVRIYIYIYICEREPPVWLIDAMLYINNETSGYRKDLLLVFDLLHRHGCVLIDGLHRQGQHPAPPPLPTDVACYVQMLVINGYAEWTSNSRTQPYVRPL